MTENEENQEFKELFLFQHLIAMFHTLALQQLGKLVNPITGNLERDLQQARITIDMIQMLQRKTSGNLRDAERALLDRVLVELQMNYVDEASRGGGEEGGIRKPGGQAAQEAAPSGEEGEGGPKATGDEEAAQGETTRRTRKSSDAGRSSDRGKTKKKKQSRSKKKT